MGEIESIIFRIRQHLSEGGYQNETAVREAIVLPILAGLGWDVWDPEIVRREYRLSGRRVDYALCPMRRRPAVFLEIKAVNQASGSDRQLFEYAYHEGIPMAVLTDGKEWNFYLPGEQGTYDDRRFYKLDLNERSDKECSDRLSRYLGFAFVNDERALENARNDYRQAARAKIANESIPKAWNELVDEPDELLIEIITERVESISGFRPDSEDVERFLLENIPPPTATTPNAKREVGQNALNHSFGRTADKQPLKTVGERQVIFEIFSEKRTGKNAKEAMIAILQKLAEGRQDFWDRLAQRARTKKRNHLARSREAVYPLRPDLAENTLEISPGWWIGTNIANREKQRIIAAACECANVSFGKDVKIELPNLNA